MQRYNSIPISENIFDKIFYLILNRRLFPRFLLVYQNVSACVKNKKKHSYVIKNCLSDAFLLALTL